MPPSFVQIEYDALDPVVDAEQALKDKNFSTKKLEPTRSGTEYSNTAMWSRHLRMPHYVVHIDRLHFHRFSSTPLENNVVIAQWDPKDERIYYQCNNSFPSFAIQFLCGAPRRSH